MEACLVIPAFDVLRINYSRKLDRICAVNGNEICMPAFAGMTNLTPSKKCDSKDIIFLPAPKRLSGVDGYSESPLAAALARRWRVASARDSIKLRVSSQPTQASVMLCP